MVMNAFHFIGHLQIEAIRDLTGDGVNASHKASEVFHVFIEKYKFYAPLRYGTYTKDHGNHG
jgi:hypothetical protein